MVVVTIVGWRYRVRAATGPGVVGAEDHSVLLDEVSPAELGLLLYPGAQPIGRAAAQHGPGWSMTSVVLATPDPPEQVAEYYLRAWPGAKRYAAGGVVTIASLSATGSTTVRIERRGDTTRIALLGQATAATGAR